jgi:AcrR family transcriptional regulator
VSAERRNLTPRKRQRLETRKKVYQAALSVFRRDGVNEARIEDIVKLAGVANGTFYFHFPTKDDVLSELLRESITETVKSIEALPVGTALEQVLEAVCRAMAKHWKDDRALFSAVGVVALRITAAGSHDTDPVPQALAPHFNHASAKGVLTPTAPPELLAQLFLLNVFAASLACCSNDALPFDVVLPGVAKLFLDGARHRKK